MSAKIEMGIIQTLTRMGSQLVARVSSVLAIGLLCPVASATHVQLFIDNTGAIPQVSLSGVYDLQISTTTGRASVTGGLYWGDIVATGKRAVGLLGFGDDLVLLEAQAPTEVLTTSAGPELIQYFTFDFYSDPVALGFDPALLLTDYSVNYVPNTLANTCPHSGDCVGTPDGYFDLTSELGNPPDTLRVSVKTALVPLSEPATSLLVALAVAALAALRRRQPTVQLV